MKHTIALNESTFGTYSSLLHDTVCRNWYFDYGQKQLIVHLECEDSIEKPSQITFNNVLGHEMVSCDFWGASPHILSWNVLTNAQRYLYPRYVNEINKNGYVFARLLPDERYMEVEILFTSGDKLTVLCQDILVELLG